MPVTIDGGGLHKILSILLITFIILNSDPIHKLIRLLHVKCDGKN